MMNEDPDGPRFLVLKWNPGPDRPSTRKMLQVENLKITRTYAMEGKPSKHAPSGISIRNKVFSDLSPGETLLWEVKDVTSADATAWRVGYYNETRSWEQAGPEPGTENSITRRFTSQKNYRAQIMPKWRPSFLDLCSAKALSLRKSAAKKKRQVQNIRKQDSAPSSDSDTSSSSSSSSSSTSSSEAHT